MATGQWTARRATVPGARTYYATKGAAHPPSFGTGSPPRAAIPDDHPCGAIGVSAEVRHTKSGHDVSGAGVDRPASRVFGDAVFDRLAAS